MNAHDGAAAGIIAKAKKLLAARDGEQAAALLLEEGYIARSQPEIQAAYLELIPPNATLREMLDTIYVGLDAANVAVRRKTILGLAREFSKETVRNNVRWMRDPRASDPIIKATADPDRTVSERALGTLMRLVSRF